MSKSLKLGLLILPILIANVLPVDAAPRKSKPWPDINLSILPSVVGMSNSWAFEINKRSPAYLSDLDKLHIAVSYGRGSNDNDIPTLTGRPAGRYGYSFYRGVDYKFDNFKLDVYSHLGKKTFGSLWATYGEDKDRRTKEAFLVSEPNRLNVKTAFAWNFRPHLTAAVAGTFNNYPRSYIFALQPSGSAPADSQFALPANVGENLEGQVDLMYRTDNNLDIIFGGRFIYQHTKFAAPDPPAGAGYRDTSEVKEFVYSGAPRVIVKKTFQSGSYLRAGASLYFNLFDYQYAGAGKWNYPSTVVPSYRAQSFDTMVPNWEFYVDGSKLLGANAAVYSALEFSGYPNRLTRKDTDFVPVDLSLVDADNIFSTALTVDFSAKLTRIFNGMAGVTVRHIGKGDETNSTISMDDRSLYASLRFGTMTRFYRNLWWTIRVNDLHLYTSEAVGTAALFENTSYFETEILFLGL